MLVKLDPPLENLRGLLAPARPPRPFPFGQPGLSLHFSGRYALYAGLRALGLPPGAVVLVPAYNCGTEVEPVLRAGLMPRFYRVGRDLGCRIEDIEEGLERSGARALLLTHYFGLPQPRVAEVAALCRERGAALIEDCAHALLGEHEGRPLGSFGEAAVFSLIKPLPLPDGGLFMLNNGAAVAAPEQNPPPAALIRHLLARIGRHNSPAEGGWPAWAWPVLLERGLGVWRRAAELAGARSAGVDPRATSFRPEAATWRMSALSRGLLARLDLEAVKAARRRNFSTLLAHFRERHPDCLIFRELPEGACPLLFPVRLRRKPPELFARSLAGWGVEACAWWRELHPAVPWEDFPEERALKGRVLALPVHQGLGEEEMARIASAFEAAWRVLGR